MMGPKYTEMRKRAKEASQPLCLKGSSSKMLLLQSPVLAHSEKMSSLIITKLETKHYYYWRRQAARAKLANKAN